MEAEWLERDEAERRGRIAFQVCRIRAEDEGRTFASGVGRQWIFFRRAGFSGIVWRRFW
jgi:hypothetical protein